MKNETMLAQIYGELSALVCLPLNKPLGQTQSANHAGWVRAYADAGLSFSTSRDDVSSLRRLVADGRLSARGSTQSRGHTMTGGGVRSAMASIGESWAGAGKLLSSIISKQETGGRISPYGHHEGARIVMAWDLIPGAGEWLDAAQKTDKAWKAYIKELCRLQGRIAPLLILSYASLYHDSNGYVWGVMPTSAGKDAAAQWPDELPATDDAEVFEAWMAGYDNGEKYAKPPPSDFSNVCPVLLPAAGW